MEYDTRCFRSELPRLRVVPVEEFDPAKYF